MNIQLQVAQWFDDYNRRAAARLDTAPALRGLYEPVYYTISQPGKRLRPTLMLCGNQLFGGNPDDVREAAIGIELFHNFTLIHDDLMDNSPLRRGLPTVYSKWNANTAILSGDAMFSLAWQQMIAHKHQATPDVLDCFNQTATLVYEGQQYDMDFENQPQVSLDQYLEMIKLKTAVLLAGALKIGALYASAPAADIELLYNTGIGMGLAFQLQDDLLDAYGDTTTLGKQTAQDIRDNKKTYLYIKALSLADNGQKKQLNTIFSHKDKEETEIQQVLDIYSQLGIRRLTEQAIVNHTEQALSSLAKINVPESRKEVLHNLITSLLNREK